MFNLYKYIVTNKETLMLKLKLKKILKQDVVIVCIGTPRVNGDSVGPIIGSKLLLRNCKYPVYGTISDPITALNIDKKIKEILAKHPNNTILAIDSSTTTNKNKLNKILLEKKPIEPGSALNKQLMSIGDFSIKVVSTIHSDDNVELMHNLYNVDMDNVYTVADKVVNMIL